MKGMEEDEQIVPHLLASFAMNPLAVLALNFPPL
jgi:hypothetical protein